VSGRFPAYVVKLGMRKWFGKPQADLLRHLSLIGTFLTIVAQAAKNYRVVGGG
jgi:hypothetical protein